jgi:hypothetical protein
MFFFGFFLHFSNLSLTFFSSEGSDTGYFCSAGYKETLRHKIINTMIVTMFKN